MDKAVKAGKQEKDTVASALLPAVCAISVGAWGRLESREQKYGVALLCGFFDDLETPEPVSLPGPLRAD